MLSLGLVIQILRSNAVEEGRKIGEAHRTSSDIIGLGWPRAAPKSAGFPRRATWEPSLRALLGAELAEFNPGLCVITTRLAVVDLADYEPTSAQRLDLNQLSSDAGAKLLLELGVKGSESELRSASKEFSGHCLALTLLGSYLTDACNGDIRRRKEVHLGDDERREPVLDKSWHPTKPGLAKVLSCRCFAC